MIVSSLHSFGIMAGKRLKRVMRMRIFAIPLKAWVQTPKTIRVLPADTLQVDGVESPTVVFIAFVDKTEAET